MNTLIIPTCGSSNPNELPMWLESIPFGYPLICRIIEKSGYSTFDKIIIVSYSWMEEAFNIKQTVLSKLPKKVDFLFLKTKTSSQAETVFLAIQHFGLVGSIVVHDDDLVSELPPHPYHNFIGGINIFDSTLSASSIKNKSFISINEQNQILDIVEKKIKSNYVSYGVYGFKNVQQFSKAYLALSNPDYSAKGLFLSHIVDYLIGVDNVVFHFVPILDYVSWEDKQSFLSLCRSHTTIFVKDTALVDRSFVDEMITLSNKGNNFVIISKFTKQDVITMLGENLTKINIKGFVENVQLANTVMPNSYQELKEYE